MLDDFKDKQPVIYQVMKNAVENQKISHAYLLDIKNCSYGQDMALAFVKYLLCPYHKSSFKDCEKCVQCKKIDESNYTELKIIEPDGLWIKKEQMDELQKQFSKKVLTGTYKIYILHQVERLNKAAANSLLKFLEEPEEGIIAILTTNNLFQVLETIRSRCQIFSFHGKEKQSATNPFELLPNFVGSGEPKEKNEEKNKNIIYDIINFIEILEKTGKETLLDSTKLFHSKIKEKEDLIFAFDVMTFFYYDVLNHQCGRKLLIFMNEIEKIEFVSQNNTMEKIVYKIGIIMSLKKKIKLNVNNGLLIDKLILELIGGQK